MCDVDFGTEVGKIHQAAPFISITGIAGNNCQVFLCGEGDKFFESTSLKENIIIVVLLCLCPKLVNSILLFFQHYVFKMTKLVGNLNKLYIMSLHIAIVYVLISIICSYVIFLKFYTSHIVYNNYTYIVYIYILLYI